MWNRAPSRLQTRLWRLEMEAESGAEDRMYVICRDQDEPQEAAITRHGITPQPEDTVVLITCYSVVRCAVCTPPSPPCQGREIPQAPELAPGPRPLWRI